MNETLQPTSNLKKLYENLSKREGFTVPYNQFELDMKDDVKMKTLHGNLAKSPEFTVPYEQFRSDMFSSEAEAELQTQNDPQKEQRDWIKRNPKLNEILQSPGMSPVRGAFTAVKKSIGGIGTMLDDVVHKDDSYRDYAYNVVMYDENTKKQGLTIPKHGSEEWKKYNEERNRYIEENSKPTEKSDLYKASRKFENETPISKGGVGEFVGGLIPSVGGVIASMYGGPAVANAYLGTMLTSSYGMGVEAYDDEKKASGEKEDPFVRTAVGTAYGAAEYIAEKLGLDYFMPKGFGKLTAQSLKENPQLTKKIGTEILENYARLTKQPVKDIVKKLAVGTLVEGGEEGVTEAIQIMTDAWMSDIDVSGEDVLSRMGQSIGGGMLMGGMIAPFSMKAQSASNRNRRRQQGNVTISFTEDGTPVELVENKQGVTVGLTPDGEIITGISSDVKNKAKTFQTEDFEAGLKELKAKGSQLSREWELKVAKNNIEANLSPITNAKTGNVHAVKLRGQEKDEDEVYFVVDVDADGFANIVDRQGNKVLDSEGKPYQNIEDFTTENVISREQILQGELQSLAQEQAAKEQTEAQAEREQKELAQVPQQLTIPDENGKEQKYVFAGEVRRNNPEKPNEITDFEVGLVDEFGEMPYDIAFLPAKTVYDYIAKQNEESKAFFDEQRNEVEQAMSEAEKEFSSENGQNVTTTPSEDNNLSGKEVKTFEIEGKEVKYTKNEDYFEIVPTEKMPLNKAASILQKKYKDSKKYEVEVIEKEVTTPEQIIPAKHELEEDEIIPASTKIVTESVKILPKGTLEQRRKEEQESKSFYQEQKKSILIDALTEFNATPESRSDKQKASEIEALATKLGYMTDRSPMNEIRIFNNKEGYVNIPKTAQPEKSGQINQLQTNENISNPDKLTTFKPEQQVNTPETTQPKATKPPTPKQIERAKLLKSEPNSAREVILKYFLSGGKVSPEMINRESIGRDRTGKLRSEGERRSMFWVTKQGEAKYTDQLEHILHGTPWENMLDDPTDFSNEVLDVLSLGTPSNMMAELKRLQSEQGSFDQQYSPEQVSEIEALAAQQAERERLDYEEQLQTVFEELFENQNISEQEIVNLFYTNNEENGNDQNEGRSGQASTENSTPTGDNPTGSIEADRGNDTGEESQTERFGLKPTQTIQDLSENINSILEQYSGREMAAIQTEKYLNEFPELGQQYLNGNNITSRDELKSHLAKLQSKVREGKGKERQENKKQFKGQKTQQAIDEIEQMALAADAEMQKQIEESEYNSTSENNTSEKSTETKPVKPVNQEETNISENKSLPKNETSEKQSGDYFTEIQQNIPTNDKIKTLEDKLARQKKLREQKVKNMNERNGVLGDAQADPRQIDLFAETFAPTQENFQKAIDKVDAEINSIQKEIDLERRVLLTAARENKGQLEIISKEESKVDTNPTEAQKEAGNYKKGHVTIQGLDITIENPKGSIRSGVDKTGKPWSVTMNNTYGYFKRTVGKDGDHVDVFLGDKPLSEKVFVIDQNKEDGSFDESKVMLGFDSADQAQSDYMKNYSSGWKGFGSMTESSIDDFKEWLNDGARQNKAYSEYKQNQSVEANEKVEVKPEVNSSANKATEMLNDLLSKRLVGEKKTQAIEYLQKHINDLDKANQHRFNVYRKDNLITPTPKYGENNKIVTNERAEELKKRLRDKLNNLNVGFDPELLAIGTELAAYHIESGARKFADFSKKMIEDVGEAIKPYLKAIYNGARDIPGMEAYEPEMTEYSEVKNADIDELLKPSTKNNVQENKLKENGKQRVLQGNNKRAPKPASPSLFDRVEGEQRTGGSIKLQSGEILGTNGEQQQPTGREGNLLPRNADLLEPALVEFNADENDTKSFNPTQKYNDNIAAIETVISLIREKRAATPQEKETLSKYVGFGGLKDVVLNPEIAEGWKPSNIKYKPQVKRIIELANEFNAVSGAKDSLGSITGSILNAHFTSSTVIHSVYDGLKKLGFKGGQILEPSAGIGNFVTFMPNQIKSNSTITAVELDDLTGNILKYLHDDVNVKVSGIQDANIPNNSQDLVISNVPFGNYKIFDKAFKGVKEQFQNRIHNYFFAKAVDMAREGGLIAFVTSKGVMDAPGNEQLRRYLDQNTEFLGAVRLPNSAFKNNANTEVVTDIIFLKKNSTINKSNPNFINVFKVSATHKDGEQQEVGVNQYFVDHPENILGDIVAGGLYSRDDYTVENKKEYDLSAAITKALPKDVYTPTTSGIGLQANDSQETIDAIKEGNIHLTNGRLVRKQEGQLVDISINEPTAKIEHYITLRDSLMNLIYSEYLGKSDKEVNELRFYLNRQYDTFVKKYGKLDKSAIKIAKQDADGYNVLSLEVKGKQDGKADIFRQRTIQPIQNKLTAENIDEAIVISLYEHAKIDIERIAELMNLTIPEAIEKAKGKIFEEPTGGFVTRDEYLSGNVKQKLKQAQQAVENGNTEFQNNVDELQNVIPRDIPAMNIEARLGSRWIPQQVYTDFAQYLFNTPQARIIYQKSIDAYSHDGRVGTVEATNKYGTSRRNGLDILVDALLINPPKIFDTIREFGQEKRVLNTEETAKAIEKYEEIRQKFEDWVYKSEDRRTLLSGIYNERFNTSVKRSYNGDHLNISGINGVELRKHQKDAIWMLLQNNGGIIDHLVGAGKTYVMVAGTMEMKRTGVAKKPMIMALKSTIPQIVESYRNAFPMAKILAPLEKDFTKENRNKLFAQIANNEWDVIIMSHENYGKIPHESDIQQKFIEDEMAEIEEERAELSAAGEKQALKGLEIRLKNLEARLEKISNIDKDNSLTFEQMGIDHIMVDESQQFKNLSYVTKQRGVAGLSKAEGSKRAFNLFIGIRYLQQKYGEDKGTTFLSGTPISNSMVEMYLLLKYLRPGKMNELGFNSFDAWATTFASPSSDIEFTVTGDFKAKTRFREFINVPELSMLYTEIADIRTDENTPLDKPKMKGGGYTVEEIKMSEDQIEYGKKLMEFARTKNGSHIGMTLSKNQETAAMLLATNLSSKMAIDMRLIDSGFSYDPNGKIAKLADNVARIYNETDKYKGTQLIFSDLGTPKNKTNKAALLRDYMEDEMGVNLDTLNEIFGDTNEQTHRYPSVTAIKNRLSEVLEMTESEIETIIEEANHSEGSFNVYAEVKQRLIEKGIPAEQVVFIHDYNSQRAKEGLFKEVQQGNIRIVLGSTQKLGTGVNVQDRVVAVHHLDVPWTPASMEQRNGRALRQGNKIAKEHLNNELPVYAYATERTLDAYKYQLLQTKQRFLDQVKSGEVEDRVIRESDGDSESGVGYAELVAMLSGNTDILTKSKLETKVNDLKRKKRNFLSEVYEAKSKIDEIETRNPQIEKRIELTTQNIKELTNAMQYDENGKMVVNDIDGKKLTTVKDEKGKIKPAERTDYAKEAIKIVEDKLNKAKTGDEVDLFTINGIKISGRSNEASLIGTQNSSLFINASNGEKYSVNFSLIPGAFLNNIQKTIENIPNIQRAQEAIVEKNKRDLKAYHELLEKGTEWEKEAELTQAIEELKEVTKRLTPVEEAKPEQTVETEPESPITLSIKEETFIPKPEIKDETPIAPQAQKEPAIAKLLPVEEFRHTKTGQILYNVKINGRSDEYSNMVSVAKRYNPYGKQKPYNTFSKGFLFEKKEDAENFKNEVNNTAFNQNIANEPYSPYQNNGDVVNDGSETYEIYRYFESKFVDYDLVLLKQGDFYEALGNSALNTSSVLGTVMTRRNDGKRIYNVTGFPSHSLETYLPKLRRSGLSVIAIDENGNIQTPSTNKTSNGTSNQAEEVQRTTEPDNGNGPSTDNLQRQGDTTEYSNNGGYKGVKGQVYQELKNLILTHKVKIFDSATFNTLFNKLNTKKVTHLTSSPYNTFGNPFNIAYTIYNQLEDYNGENFNDPKELGFDEEDNTPRFRKSDKLPETINIKGIERPTTNSKGQPIADSEEKIRNFYKWFGDSKVVDEEGRPLVVYHGTDYEFTEFDKNMVRHTGFFFSIKNSVWSDWGKNEMPVYLNIRNAATPSNSYENSQAYRELSQKAIDGIMFGDMFVVTEPTQIKSATDNIGTFDGSNPDIRFRKTSPIGFYSTVESALEQIKQEKGSVEQFKPMLLKNGAKQAEMDWMGFDDRFPDTKKSITKADIQNWIDQNRIEVEEVVKGVSKTLTREQALKALDQGKQVYGIDDEGVEGLIETIDDLDSFERWALSEDLAPSETKYQSYQEPGGSNYKEVLLTMPEKSKQWLTKADSDELYKLESNSILSDEEYSRLKELRIKANELERNNFKSDFRSSHFDEPNILAHVRFNEREVNGERVLFLEEIQSDLAQSNRKELQKLAEPNRIREQVNNIFGSELSSVMPFELMDAGMISMLHHDEVRKDIISRIPIDVMDVLKSYNLSAEDILSNSSVNLSPIPFELRRRIGLVFLNSLRDARASLRTELLRGGPTGSDKQLLSTLKASDLSSGEIVGMLSPNSIYHDDVLLFSGSRNVTTSGTVNTPSLGDVAGRNPELNTTMGTNGFDSGKSTLSGTKPSGISLTGLNGEMNTASLAKFINWHNSIIKGNVKQTLYKGSPIVDNTKDFVNLSLRRMMRYAAENGFDRIAWTNGEMQAARYDLSKQVDKITVSPSSESKISRNPDYFKDIVIDMLDSKTRLSINKDGKVIEGGDAYFGKGIDDLVGKDIAEKILNSEGETSLSGLDLKVGGSGMKAFYDAIVPSAANKLGKPFGAKVENVVLSYDYKVPGIFNTKEKAQQFVDENKLEDVIINPEPRYNGFSIRNSDGSTIKGVKQPKATVQSLPVTDKMIESVSQGVPLFRNEYDTPIEAAERIVKAMNQRAEMVKGMADRLSNELNTPIIVVRNETMLPRNLQRQVKKQGAKRSVMGVYNPTDGKIYLVSNNIPSELEAEKTVLHEIVGHKGLRGLLGAKEHRKLMEMVWNSLTPAQKADLNRRLGNLDPLILADEYMAELAEQNSTPKWYEKVLAKLREMLRKIFPNLRLNNTELKTIIRKSYEALKRPAPEQFDNPLDFAEALAKFEQNNKNQSMLTEREFYKKYKAQHKDIRSKGSKDFYKTFNEIQSSGFDQGAWALPVYKGGEPTNIIQSKYANKKGDFIYLVPKEWLKDTNAGWRVKEGWKPNIEDIIEIEYDNQSSYEAYVKAKELTSASFGLKDEAAAPSWKSGNTQSNTPESKNVSSNTIESNSRINRSDANLVNKVIPKYPETDYELTKEEDWKFAMDLQTAISKKISHSDYQIVNGNTLLRIKDHTPNWVNFEDDIENNPNIKRIINITVGDYNNSDFRRNKWSINELEEKYPDIEFIDFEIEDGESLFKSIDLISMLLNKPLSDTNSQSALFRTAPQQKEEGSDLDIENKSIDRKKQRIQDKIEQTPNESETHKKRTILKQKIKDLESGWKSGEVDTKAMIWKVQTDVIEYAKKNMPFDKAGKAEINRLLRLVRYANNPKHLETVLEKIDTIVSGLDIELKLNNIDKILHDNIAKNVNGKPQGTLDPKVYLMLDKVRAIRKLKGEDEIDQYVDSLNEDDIEGITLFSVFGNLEEKSRDEINDALDKLISIVSTGKVWYYDQLQKRKKINDGLRAMVLDKVSGGQGLVSELDLISSNSQVKTGAIGRFINSHINFEWLLDKISKDKSEETGKGKMQEYFGDVVTKATNDESKGIREQTDFIHKKASEIFGVDGSKLAKKFHDNTKVIKKSGVTYINREGKRVEIPLSQNQAYKKWMEWQDQSLSKTFEIMGWDETTRKELDKFIFPDVKEWAEWQLKEYYPGYYEGINQKYNEAYFANLGRNENYSPIRREVVSPSNVEDAMMQKPNVLASVGNQSLKTRKSNINNLLLVDGDSILAQHIAQMEHFKAWVMPINQLRSVFSSREVQKAIKNNHGVSVLSNLNNQIADMARGGEERANIIDFVDKVRRNFVTAELGANISLFPKQSVSLLAYLSEVPVKNYVTGMLDLALHLRKAIGIIKSNEMVTERFQKGWAPEIRAAMKQDTPGALSQSRNILGNLRNILLFPTKMGDYTAVIGGWVVYKYHYDNQIAKGINEQEAHDFALNQVDRSVSRTQQSGALKDVSQIQKGSWNKVLTMFKSSPIQQFRYENAAFRNLINGRGSVAQNAKIIALYHIIMPVMFQLISNLFTDDDDDKERNRLLRAGVLGSFNSLMVVGDIIESVLEKIMGESWGDYSATPLEGSVTKGLQGVGNISSGIKDLDKEKILKGVDQLIYGINNIGVGLPYRPVKKLIKQGDDILHPEKVKLRKAEEEYKKIKKEVDDWTKARNKAKNEKDFVTYRKLSHDDYMFKKYTSIYGMEDFVYGSEDKKRNLEKMYKQDKISEAEYIKKLTAIYESELKTK